MNEVNTRLGEENGILARVDRNTIGAPRIFIVRSRDEEAETINETSITLGVPEQVDKDVAIALGFGNVNMVDFG
jgi:hypothetical protein